MHKAMMDFAVHERVETPPILVRLYPIVFVFVLISYSGTRVHSVQMQTRRFRKRESWIPGFAMLQDLTHRRRIKGLTDHRHIHGQRCSCLVCSSFPLICSPSYLKTTA